MIGLLIVTHSDLGREFLNAAEFIVGRLDAADAVSITQTADSEQIRKMIEEKVSALDTGEGVLILTDMLGLPMVIAIAQNRGDMDLSKLAEMAQEAGKTSISLASKLLESG
jgi:PTS system mannose-specific IIA component